MNEPLSPLNSSSSSLPLSTEENIRSNLETRTATVGLEALREYSSGTSSTGYDSDDEMTLLSTTEVVTTSGEPLLIKPSLEELGLVEVPLDGAKPIPRWKQTLKKVWAAFKNLFIKSNSAAIAQSPRIVQETHTRIQEEISSKPKAKPADDQGVVRLPRASTFAHKSAFAAPGTPKVDTKAVATANLAQQGSTPILQGATGAWQAMKVSSLERKMTENAMTTTSEVNIKGQQNTGLTSTLVNKRADGQLNITCGAITTKQKAREFAAILAKQIIDNSGKDFDQEKPVNISIHQVNSFLTEAKLIINEHAMCDEIIDTLHAIGFPNVRLLHTNNSLNAATTSAFAPNELTYCEAINKEARVDYQALYEEKTKLLEAKIAEIGAKIAKKENPGKPTFGSHELDNAPPIHSQEIENLTNELKALKTLWESYQQLSPSSSAEQSTKLQMELMLDRFLGVHSVINCKSGLDRTGIGRGMTIALDHMIETVGIVETTNFLLNQEPLIGSLNTLQAQSPSWEAFQKEVNQHPDLTVAFKFQASVVEALFDISIPTTAISTGMTGLKYGHKKGSFLHGQSLKSFFAANPHIIRLLPHFIQRPDGKIIRIIGQDQQFTKEGLDYVQGLSSSRES